MCLGAFRIDLQHVVERSGGFFELLERLVNATKAEMSIYIGVVKIYGALVVLESLLVLTKIVVGRGQVEMTLR